ncbi:hypothetical protein Hdeb2414_s0002g00069531 [Helianthus debilis subsp. tardiflorus]
MLLAHMVGMGGMILRMVIIIGSLRVVSRLNARKPVRLEEASIYMKHLKKMHYFDIKSFQNTEHWDAIKESIQVECASRFKDKKSGMKKHFDRHGGYKDVEEAKRHPPPRVNGSRSVV